MSYQVVKRLRVPLVLIERCLGDGLFQWVEDGIVIVASCGSFDLVAEHVGEGLPTDLKANDNAMMPQTRRRLLEWICSRAPCPPSA